MLSVFGASKHWIASDDDLNTADLGATDRDPASHYAAGIIANALPVGGVDDVPDATRSLIENAIGGSGADTFVANEAINELTGGGGPDVFVWTSLADAQNLAVGGGEDLIIDFASGDQIDLTALNIDHADYEKAGDGYDLIGYTTPAGNESFRVHVEGTFVEMVHSRRMAVEVVALSCCRVCGTGAQRSGSDALRQRPILMRSATAEPPTLPFYGTQPTCGRSDQQPPALAEPSVRLVAQAGQPADDRPSRPARLSQGLPTLRPDPARQGGGDVPTAPDRPTPACNDNGSFFRHGPRRATPFGSMLKAASETLGPSARAMARCRAFFVAAECDEAECLRRWRAARINAAQGRLLAGDDEHALRHPSGGPSG